MSIPMRSFDDDFDPLLEEGAGRPRPRRVASALQYYPQIMFGFLGLGVIGIIAIAVVSLMPEDPSKYPQYDPIPSTKYWAVYLESISTDQARTHLEGVAAHGRSASDPAKGLHALQYVNESLVSWGFEPEFRTYHVYLTEPADAATVRLSVDDGPEYDASFAESGHGVAAERKATLPFAAYSAMGAAQGPAYYANHGSMADFAVLKDLGCSLDNAVAIARLGEIEPSAIARNAAKYNMAGVIVFLDLEGQNADADKVAAVPRVSVLNAARHFGDPLTIGRPAHEDARPGSLDDAPNLPNLVVQPVSFGDAKEMLALLSGEPVPDGWGGLAAKVGSGSEHLTIEVNQRAMFKAEVTNIVVEIPGYQIENDGLVVVGNQRDSWGPGGADPGTGTAAFLELARGLSVIRAAGWQPRRTVMLGSWDASLYGAVGASEFIEEHGKRIADQGVLYMDIGPSTGDQVDVTGSPSLSPIMHTMAEYVRDPTQDWSVSPSVGDSGDDDVDAPRFLYDLWLQQTQAARPEAMVPKMPAPADNSAGAFVAHSGMASARVAFSGGDSFRPFEQTLLDTLELAEGTIDGSLQRTAVVAQLAGLVALDFANSQLLSLNHFQLASHLFEDLGVLNDALAAAAVPGCCATEDLGDAIRNLTIAAGIAADQRNVIEEDPYVRPAVDDEFNDRLRRAEFAFMQRHDDADDDIDRTNLVLGLSEDTGRPVTFPRTRELLQDPAPASANIQATIDAAARVIWDAGRVLLERNEVDQK